MSKRRNDFSSFSSRMDAISCIGGVLLFLCLVIGLGAVWGGESAESTPTLIAILPSPETNILPSLTPLPNPTNTQPATDAPTPTRTQIPTNTPIPPEASIPPLIDPTATQTPLPLPTATETHTPPPTPTAIEITQLPPNSIPPSPMPILPTPNPEGDYSARIPILMYHYTSIPPENADIYRTDLSVAPNELRKQLTYLRDNGFTTIDLYTLSLALANLQPLPEKSIILTFDDGHLDHYINAFPLLKEFGMIGTFFIITDLPDIEHKDHMSWAMIEEMAAAGMSIEMHTRGHLSLAGLKYKNVYEQILDSQHRIEEHLGYTPRFLAYPGGSYDDRTLEVGRDLDIWGALTTKWGSQHVYRNRLELRRLRMRNTTTINGFAEIVNLRVPE